MTFDPTPNTHSDALVSEESRLHDRTIASRQNGRTLASILCPFCGCTTEAYVWSLAGSGKRCRGCRAKHIYHPAITIRRTIRGGQR